MWAEDYINALSHYNEYIEEYEEITNLKLYKIYYNHLIAEILTKNQYIDTYNIVNKFYSLNKTLIKSQEKRIKLYEDEIKSLKYNYDEIINISRTYYDEKIALAELVDYKNDGKLIERIIEYREYIETPVVIDAGLFKYTLKMEGIKLIAKGYTNYSLDLSILEDISNYDILKSHKESYVISAYENNILSSIHKTGKIIVLYFLSSIKDNDGEYEVYKFIRNIGALYEKYVE